MVTENAAQGHTTVDEEEVIVELNWQFDDSNNNGSENSGSYENLEDKLGYLLQKRGAQKGLDERDPDYILEEEVWQYRSSYTIIIIITCSTLNLLIQFVGSQS
jgi:hypothetical protein